MKWNDVVPQSRDKICLILCFPFQKQLSVTCSLKDFMSDTEETYFILSCFLFKPTKCTSSFETNTVIVREKEILNIRLYSYRIYIGYSENRWQPMRTAVGSAQRICLPMFFLFSLCLSIYRLVWFVTIDFIRRMIFLSFTLLLLRITESIQWG